MTPHDAVLNFRDLLNAAFPQFSRTVLIATANDQVPADDIFDDWAQANYELFVERVICKVGEFLAIYGNGSDYEAALHSRVFFHDAATTHHLVCIPSGDRRVVDVLSDGVFDPEPCTFERLVARSDGWYENAPPFDHVLLDDRGTERVVALSSIHFVLRSGPSRI